VIHSRLSDQLQTFTPYPRLHSRVVLVLDALPPSVQRDFTDDPSFRIALEDTQPGSGWKLFMNCPTHCGAVSRCVVLRCKLNEAPSPFIDYVIAHEFAHAYLRNGGWGEITDIEEAADALAASWGFLRPPHSPVRGPK
jgi:hypothetical protein